MTTESTRTVLRGLLLSGILIIFSASPVWADDLLRSIQQDLAELGYEPGTPDGVSGSQTQLAIAKFEEANDMPVTGKPSLAVAAAASNQAEAMRKGDTAGRPNTAGAESSGAALVAKRNECLQRQQQAQQKSSGWSNLARLGTRVAGRLSGVNTSELNQHVQTAEDMAGIADELGLSQAQVEECM